MAFVSLVKAVINRNDTLTVNVLGLVHAELANSKLTVGGLGGTVTTRQIVDD